MKRMESRSGLWPGHLIMLVVGLCLFVVGMHPAWAATVSTAGDGGAAASLAQIAKDLAPAKPFFVTSDGKWIAPLMYIGSFALLANGLMHLDPARKKASEFGVGIITATAGIMWWPFLIAMMVARACTAAPNPINIRRGSTIP